ncbi:hypothetical protein H6G33_16450 [Calothrix sp. FACHB-1219]|uniref:hypothetical protein n=1 Tax=unclassified Calothrix TaxID=2619626 RepID=UPI0016887C21|nr:MULTISPECIES: hypothetical protein [unclassified Calothrix]MBD2206808.1 hypothetical protein [Calothrix sp. FACHB-168]MBD2218626.1 hypothetical protein [Calothrix sp. FACHB-1219]
MAVNLTLGLIFIRGIQLVVVSRSMSIYIGGRVQALPLNIDCLEFPQQLTYGGYQLTAFNCIQKDINQGYGAALCASSKSRRTDLLSGV